VTDNIRRLNVINITDPAAPALAAFLSFPGSAFGVAVSGNFAYLADGNSGLKVINITNPAAPVLTGEFLGCYGRGVAISGNYAYVAAGTSGLRVINIANPATPALVGSATLPGHAYGIAVSGNYAYVADGDSGLYVICITNPAAPVTLGSHPLRLAWGMSVTGDYAYVADFNDGLRVINITNPAAPALAGYYDTPGSSQGVALSGVYAYVADGSYFGIYDISHFVTPPNAPDSLVIQYLPQTQRMQVNWARVLTDTSNHPISVSRYTIYRSASLDSVHWDSVGVPVPPDTTMFVDSMGTGVNGFYRVKAIK
jgi:hypothetical protein